MELSLLQVAHQHSIVVMLGSSCYNYMAVSQFGKKYLGEFFIVTCCLHSFCFFSEYCAKPTVARRKFMKPRNSSLPADSQQPLVLWEGGLKNDFEMYYSMSYTRVFWLKPSVETRSHYKDFSQEFSSQISPCVSLLTS